jgi:hypothetical protein
MLSFSDVHGALVLAVQSCTRPTEIGRFFNVEVIDLPMKNAVMTHFVGPLVRGDVYSLKWGSGEEGVALQRRS